MHRFTASAIYLALLSGAFALPQAAPTTTAAPSSPSASSGQFDENFATWTEGETVPECGTLKLAWENPEPQGLPANDTREWTTLVTSKSEGRAGVEGACC